MRHYRKYFLTSILVVAGLALTGCDNNKNEMSTTEAENMINAAFEAKQFERMQSLADSLEKAGVLSKGESYYWQGYANYHLFLETCGFHLFAKQLIFCSSQWCLTMVLFGNQ